jgi:hypothetical protein
LNPSLFQQLWPELMVSDDTSVQNYTCPMRRLELVEPTLQATSAESSGQAGMRCSHLVFEDVVEQTNVTTPEQRLKVIETYSLLNELLDPSGYVDIRGTAWSAPTADGGCGDLYYEILKEEESAEEKQFAVLIDPCWQVKEGVNKEPYDPTLQEDEVELMYPDRLTFKWLKSKLGKIYVAKIKIRKNAAENKNVPPAATRSVGTGRRRNAPHPIRPGCVDGCLHP